MVAVAVDDVFVAAAATLVVVVVDVGVCVYVFLCVCVCVYRVLVESCSIYAIGVDWARSWDDFITRLVWW